MVLKVSIIFLLFVSCLKFDQGIEFKLVENYYFKENTRVQIKIESLSHELKLSESKRIPIKLSFLDKKYLNLEAYSFDLKGINKKNESLGYNFENIRVDDQSKGVHRIYFDLVLTSTDMSPSFKDKKLLLTIKQKNEKLIDLDLFLTVHPKMVLSVIGLVHNSDGKKVLGFDRPLKVCIARHSVPVTLFFQNNSELPDSEFFVKIVDSEGEGKQLEENTYLLTKNSPSSLVYFWSGRDYDNIGRTIYPNLNSEQAKEICSQNFYFLGRKDTDASKKRIPANE
jgi:hypothetical protein